VIEPSPRRAVRRAARAFVAGGLIGSLLLACSASATPKPSSTGSGAGSGAGGISGCPTTAPANAAAGSSSTMTIDTPKGKIVIKLEADLGPAAVGNFVALAQCGYYDGVVFHRLVPGFVIQGGDGQYGRQASLNNSKVGGGGPGYTIDDDPVKATYGRGVVAMARTANPHSQGSQFFIVLSDDARQALASANTYAIMGRVTSGMEVVDAIAAMPNSGGQANAAVDPVPMTKVTVSTP
jgi:cyclophilin family peptidyl-prolyl cis-trans isomerase